MPRRSSAGAAPGALDGLNADDPGIRQLAEAVRDVPAKELLLVHCGDLPGIQPGATRLILDVRERTGSPHCLVPDPGGDLPVDAAGFAAATVWPRAHLGKDFSEACLALAARAVREGGRVYCSARKQKGGKSLAKVLGALLGPVEVAGRSHGYHLYTAVRGADFDAALADELSARSYAIADPALGELRLASQPGVFSRRELDGGTRALLAVAEAIATGEGWSGEPGTPRRVLDLCAGIGPLGLWAAGRLPAARIAMVESNLPACAMIRRNATANGLADRVFVLEHDGLPQPGEVPELEPVDLVLLNPPTHADSETLRRLLDLRPWLRPGGRVLLVVSRPHRALTLLDELGAEISGGERDGYYVLQARWPTT